MIRPAAVDIHAPFVPEGYLDLVESDGERLGVRLRRGPDGPLIMVGAIPFGPISPRYHDLDLRIRAMDAQAVTVHALSLMPPMVYWADEALGVRLARLVNDAMAQAARAHPGRLVGLATLPMRAPEAAVAEARRAIGECGCRGVYLGTNVRGRELDDPAYLPLFEAVAALGVPVFLHPINVIGGERLGAYYLHNLLGNPFDTTVAAARLIYGGVLDRVPALRVCLPHAGGALPYLLGRLDRDHVVRPECRHLPRPPSAYLPHFFFDTISHAPEADRPVAPAIHVTQPIGEGALRRLRAPGEVEINPDALRIVLLRGHLRSRRRAQGGARGHGRRHRERGQVPGLAETRGPVGFPARPHALRRLREPCPGHLRPQGRARGRAAPEHGDPPLPRPLAVLDLQGGGLPREPRLLPGLPAVQVVLTG